MKTNSFEETFIKGLSVTALESEAVNHRYLQALREGTLPNMDKALKDFAFQYGLYSRKFTQYLSAVIQNLSNSQHKQILQDNLAEEHGDAHDMELPPEVMDTIIGQPHARLFQRFQKALGVEPQNGESALQHEVGTQWSQQFLQLCQTNEYVGIGAIGIGTEFIVSHIYNQILEGIKAHSALTMTERVFFDLHSKCDIDHANQMLQITQELAHNSKACEQIEYGVSLALELRIVFWDKLFESAQNSRTTQSPIKNLSALGY